MSTVPDMFITLSMAPTKKTRMQMLTETCDKRVPVFEYQ